MFTATAGRLLRVTAILGMLTAGGLTAPLGADPIRPAEILIPGFFMENYRGMVVWHLADGRTLRGTILLSVSGTFDYPDSATKDRVVNARLYFFGSPESDTSPVYGLTGRLAPNDRRGFLRASGVENFPAGQVPPQLDPGKIPLLQTHKGSDVISGGVLAPDGSELIFRAEFVDGIATT